MSAESPHPYRWIMLLVSWITTFVTALCLTSYSPLLNEMRLYFSMSHSEAGLLMSLPMLTMSSLQIIGGAISNRIGVRKTLIIGSTIVAISQVITSIVTAFSMEAVFRLIMGLGSSLTMICAIGLIALWFPQQELARAMSIQATGWATGNIAGVLAPIPLEMALKTDWRGPFAVFGVLASAVAIIIIVLAKDRARTQTLESDAKRSWTDLLRVKEVWTTTIGHFGVMASMTVITTWLPTVLTESGWTPTLAASISTMVPLIGIVGNLAGGALSDKLGRKKPVILITGIFGALTYVLFVFVLQTPLVWFVAASAGLFSYLFVGPLLSTLPGIPEIGPRRSGMAWGIVMAVSSVASFISPILMGEIRTTTGSYSSGFIMAAGFAAMLVVPGLLGRETGQKRRAVDQSLRAR